MIDYILRKNCLLRHVIVFQLSSKSMRIKTYRIVTLPVFCMGVKLGFSYCRRNRLRVGENRVLRKIFGSKKDEGTEGWRKIHNEKLNDLYCSPNSIRVMKSKRMRWNWHVKPMGENIDA